MDLSKNEKAPLFPTDPSLTPTIEDTVGPEAREGE